MAFLLGGLATGLLRRGVSLPVSGAARSSDTPARRSRNPAFLAALNLGGAEQRNTVELLVFGLSAAQRRTNPRREQPRNCDQTASIRARPRTARHRRVLGQRSSKALAPVLSLRNCRQSSLPPTISGSRANSGPRQDKSRRQSRWRRHRCTPECTF